MSRIEFSAESHRRSTHFASVGRGLAICAALSMVFGLTVVVACLGSDKGPPISFPQMMDFVLIEVRMNFFVLAPMMMVVTALHPALPRNALPRWMALAGLVALAGACGILVFLSGGLLIGGLNLTWNAALSPEWLPSVVARIFQFSLLFVCVREYEHRSLLASDALQDATLRQLKLKGELAASRLRTLQAQIEPHFLFNTLANARRLLRTDRAAARDMLEDLSRYLEEALPKLRDDDSTLGRELELVRAYLAVHHVRMGARLQYDITAPETLAHVNMPPLVLLTLVENALKHGLQQLVEGGAINVNASHADGKLTLTVADNGCGMGSAIGSGLGLANIRARLSEMYGSAASLSLRVNEPRGVVVVVMLPLAAQ